MARRIENNPSPSILMNSMRAIGYTFRTALADIIDNSISALAKNVYINVPINDSDLYVTILDDGEGMQRDDLFNAMKYGSEREYATSDLGRFGLGLKSASLSQCRVLTVASKYNDAIYAFQWDLDAVIENKKWDCIELENDEISSIPNIGELQKLLSGTLVVWQNFDIAYKRSNGRIREYISREIADAEKHLQLVFHRFLSNSRYKQLKIYINNSPLEALDPFLEYHPKTDSKNVSEISFNDEIIKVQPYILPHMSDLSDEDIKKLGGIEALRNDQGFYIYRNGRLIIYGQWFRLSSGLSSELIKYGRIKVDIPNSLDEIWDIDIKKQNATIPRQILNNLKKAVLDVCSRSKEKTTKRVKLTLEEDNSKIWNKTLTKDQKERFYVNKNSSFVRQFLDDFEDKDRRKILNFIDIISSTVPFDDIYNAICNKKNATDFVDEQFEAIVLEGVSQFKTIKSIIQKSTEEVLGIVTKYEPFNDERISKKIKEIVQNENTPRNI